MNDVYKITITDPAGYEQVHFCASPEELLALLHWMIAGRSPAWESIVIEDIEE